MEILEIVKTLQSYSERVVSYKLDSEFAHAVTEAVDLLIEQGERLADATDNNVGSKWIPVTERLPDLHTKVLCCGIKGGRFIAELTTWGYEKHLMWDKKNGQGCPTVTHWMPLPEPPKEVE